VLLFRYHLVPSFLPSFVLSGSVFSLSMNCVQYFSIHHIILHYSLYLTLLERLGEPLVVRKPVWISVSEIREFWGQRGINNNGAVLLLYVDLTSPVIQKGLFCC
jgi:hypothetical protein